MDVYTLSFVVSIFVVILLYIITKRKDLEKNKEMRRFQLEYFIVYTLAYFSDWLKGPYIYALYESYDISEENIAILFIIGFVSSGLFGPFVGSLADMFGRKNMSLAYFVIYIIAAICTAFDNYNILIFGRFLSGIATSLLSTVLESWMVSEHHRRKYPLEALEDTFSTSIILNSCSAILAGIFAQISANQFGYVAPFMLSLAPLTSGFILCYVLWEPDTDKSDNQVSSVEQGLKSMKTNLWILGLTQSAFLGGMYVFVFLWTPVLKIDSEVPHGIVFSTFMVMITIGSFIFKILSKYIEYLPWLVLGLGGISSFITALYINNATIAFSAFLVFELACGIMFPTYASLRSIYIPEENRATIMNIYRIPHNIFVVLILINKRFMHLQTVFVICCGTHCLGMILWYFFNPNTKIKDGNEYQLGQIRDEEEDFGDIDDDLESDISDEEDIF